MQKLIRPIVLLILLFSAFYSNAQIELSSGIDVNAPVLINHYNSKLYYKQLGFGLHLGVSYKPTQTQFFPTLNFGFGLYKLPLADFDNNVACINMNYMNLILNGNFVLASENDNTVYLIGGIGATSLKHTFPVVSGGHGIPTISIDSTGDITKLFPTVALGAEYVYGAATNKNLYLSLGLYAEYIYLFNEENNYFFTVRDPQSGSKQLSSSLTGHIIVPNFYISLHFLLGKNIIFWKKHDSMYLN